MLKHSTLIALSLVAAGVAVTSLACHSEAPTPSRHAAPRGRNPSADATPTTVDGYPVIVRIVGRRQTITVTAGPDCPLYSAATNDGKTVVAAATLEQLRREHPDLYRHIDSTFATEPNADGRARQAAESSAPDAESRGPLMMSSVD
jgi:hypothetical protein